jgi:hypothetical protein
MGLNLTKSWRYIAWIEPAAPIPVGLGNCWRGYQKSSRGRATDSGLSFRPRSGCWRQIWDLLVVRAFLLHGAARRKLTSPVVMTGGVDCLASIFLRGSVHIGREHD